jgi:hypothetical protein
VARSWRASAAGLAACARSRGRGDGLPWRRRACPCPRSCATPSCVSAPSAPSSCQGARGRRPQAARGNAHGDAQARDRGLREREETPRSTPSEGRRQREGRHSRSSAEEAQEQERLRQVLSHSCRTAPTRSPSVDDPRPGGHGARVLRHLHRSQEQGDLRGALRHATGKLVRSCAWRGDGESLVPRPAPEAPAPVRGERDRQLRRPEGGLGHALRHRSRDRATCVP